jgi:hypothetical protein
MKALLLCLFFWFWWKGEFLMKSDAHIYLLKECGTCTQASAEIGINKSALSVILNGLREPTRTEREKLRKFLGYYHYTKFFGKPKPVFEKIEGDEAVNLS